MRHAFSHAFFLGITIGDIVRIYLSIFIIIILLMIAFIFGSQNHQLVTLNYLIARAEIPMATAVSIFVSIGFLLGLFTAFLLRLYRSIQSKIKK